MNMLKKKIIQRKKLNNVIQITSEKKENQKEKISKPKVSY